MRFASTLVALLKSHRGSCQAHNVAGECREAATLQMSRAETEALLAELTRMHTSLTTCKEAAKWRHAAEFAVQLRTLLSRMLAWLVRQIGSAHLPYAMVRLPSSLQYVHM